LTPKELREKYAEVTGEVTRCGNKAALVKRIAWRLQARAEGGLSERARRRAEQLAQDADMRLTAPKEKASSVVRTHTTSLPAAGLDSRIPRPGTVLTRAYKGIMLHVTVCEHDFEYEGERYRSLSAVAKAVTGSHVNGFCFFRLGQYAK
jgi:hypothetical protein